MPELHQTSQASQTLKPYKCFMNQQASSEIEKVKQPPKQLTLMLLEDFEVDREIYRRYLKADLEHEYIFLEPELAEDTLAIPGADWANIDVVLLDYQLPDMNGMDWLEQWQQQHDGLDLPPVIVLTGQGNENIAVQFIKMGAADYIVKSQLTPERLQLAVERAIAFKKLQREKADLVERLIQRNRELAQSNNLCQIESAKKENLQQILQNVPLVVYAKEVNPDTKRSGEIWLVNREWQKIFNLSPAESIGKTDREIFPSHIAQALEANDRRLIESKQPLTTEEKVYHADGRLHEYLSFKFPVLDERDRVVSIVGVAKDITEDKQVRAALQSSKTRFSSTFEQAAVGIAHVAPDGRWLRVNQKICEILGYSKSELLQKTFQDITHPQDLQLDLKYVEQMLSGEIETYSIEKRYIRQSGAVIWINLTVSLVRDSQGKPDYFISVVEDISDRHELRTSLQQSLWRLSTLHQIDKAILEAKEPQEIARTAIERIEKFCYHQRISIVTFNYETETATILASKGLAANLVKPGTQTRLDVWQELIDRVAVAPHCEYHINYLSELERFSHAIPDLNQPGLECFVAFPLIAGGNLLGVLKIWLESLWLAASEELKIVGEISNSVAIALEQARLHRQTQNYTYELEAKVAQRTQQLEEINRELKAFTYTISHDLKAPLRAIQGFATALQEDYSDCLDNLGTEYTNRLIYSAQHMDLLIQDLLTYSRLSRSQIQLRSVNLSNVVSRAITGLELEIEQAQVKISIAEPLGKMLGNSTILVQVMSNLITNAIKFVAPEKTPQVRIWTEVKGDVVRLWIEDNGIGIKPEHQEKIYRVFERLHGNESYRGTGIGLAIVRKGMERLSGRAGVESDLNSGSRFWIEGAVGK